MFELDADIHAFLSAPSTHGLPSGERVAVLETHGAVVFLAGETAYKAKKPVRFDYMDFSTLQSREAVCQRELELNRSYAPHIYQGLSWVTRAAGGALAIDGTGERIEPLVRMRRFPAGALFSELARSDQLELKLAIPLARAVRASHEKAAPARAAASFDHLLAVLDGDVKTFTASSDVFAETGWARICAGIHEALTDCREILDARAHRGLVRRCHGDLHLDNIVLIDGEPVLFDALEFDEAFATTDIAYDLAFLLSDAVRLGQRGFANAVLNAYLARCPSEELDMLAVLPALCALRAMVRAKVSSDRAMECGPGAAKDSAVSTATVCIALAGELLQRPPPRLIALGGLSGTGKSTLARGLVSAINGGLGSVILRSDVERKAMLGHEEHERLSEPAYSAEINARTHARLIERARIALASGASVIIDAVNARADERAELRVLAERNGARFDGLWLEAPADHLRGRVAARTGDASDATVEVLERQFRYDVGPLDGWSRIDASGAPFAVLERALAAIQSTLSF
ncbi:MAG: AAA family ATPase [Pseudomonadota bacterium]